MGMIVGNYRLAPEVGGPIKTLIETEAQRVFRADKAGTDHEPLEAYAADAFAALVLGDRTLPEPVKGVNATVHVRLDYAVLARGGAVDGEVCEIPGVGAVDFNWVRDLIGSAFLTVVINGCNNRGYLERDHVHDHAKDGPTSFTNLGWLGYLHHRLKSSGWILGSRDPISGKRALTAPSVTTRSRASPVRS